MLLSPMVPIMQGTKPSGDAQETIPLQHKTSLATTMKSKRIRTCAAPAK